MRGDIRLRDARMCNRYALSRRIERIEREHQVALGVSVNEARLFSCRKIDVGAVDMRISVRDTPYCHDSSAPLPDCRQKLSCQEIRRDEIDLKHVIVARTALMSRDAVRACVEDEVVDLALGELVRDLSHACDILKIERDMLGGYSVLCLKLACKRERAFGITVDEQERCSHLCKILAKLAPDAARRSADGDNLAVEAHLALSYSLSQFSHGLKLCFERGDEFVIILLVADSYAQKLAVRL